MESRFWDQPCDNSQEGGLSEKGLCQSSPGLQTVLFPLPSSPILPSPSPLLSYPLSLCRSLSLSFSRYFFSSSSFLSASLEFKFIYKFTSFQVEQSRKGLLQQPSSSTQSVCFTLLALLMLTEVRGRERVKRTWRELYGTDQYIPKTLAFSSLGFQKVVWLLI